MTLLLERNTNFKFLWTFPGYITLPGNLNGKKSACQCRRHRRHEFNPWLRKIPWRRKWQPTPVFFPEEFHGQRSLAVYSPWGRKQLDITECLSHTHSINWMSVLTLKSLLVWVLTESGSFCSSLDHHSIPRFYYSSSHTVVPQYMLSYFKLYITVIL